MKEVTTFNKESVYSDVEPTRKDAIFLKYVGRKGDSIIFKCIGGDRRFYSFTENSRYGEVLEFGKSITHYQLSAEQVEQIIKQGKITI